MSEQNSDNNSFPVLEQEGSKMIDDQKTIDEEDGRQQEDGRQEEGILDPSFIFTKWDDLDINPDIIRGIYATGFENPSPIQSKAIIPLSKGRDIIAQAQSGTGKTAAFTIGSLSRINLADN